MKSTQGLRLRVELSHLHWEHVQIVNDFRKKGYYMHNVFPFGKRISLAQYKQGGQWVFLDLQGANWINCRTNYLISGKDRIDRNITAKA